MNIYVEVNGELFSCGITDFGRDSIQRGQHTKLCTNFAQNFTVGFLKWFSTLLIKIVVRGNFPFKAIV